MTSVDRVLNLLGKERRRYALYYIKQQDGPVPIDDVVKQVAEWETNPESSPIPADKLDQIEVELLHNDLPRASEAEYVKYDPETRVVELTEAPPKFNAILSVAKIIERPERNWE
ncbi:hypothetical protein ACFFQF_15145 [Haladaptatus pallidirubidus]|uniref:DUF7344 domain-containing protein n=1 Tax=Haladaptatus pallidirubidus TaxID=1008152 RepID=A0AAV3UD10_9EURY|nr:hypothetical protein [Haladaptatus pallidirubidus]